jgi:hypothetical protein
MTKFDTINAHSQSSYKGIFTLGNSRLRVAQLAFTGCPTRARESANSHACVGQLVRVCRASSRSLDALCASLGGGDCFLRRNDGTSLRGGTTKQTTTQSRGMDCFELRSRNDGRERNDVGRVPSCVEERRALRVIARVKPEANSRSCKTPEWTPQWIASSFALAMTDERIRNNNKNEI